MTRQPTHPYRAADVMVRMRDNGWSCPLLLRERSKAPVWGGWQRYNRVPVPRDVCVRAAAGMPNGGVGYAFGVDAVLGVDVDITDRDKAIRAALIATEIIGRTPLHRVGLLPKFASYFQRDPLLWIEGRQFGGVEYYWRSGQMAFFGIHEKTLQPYRWTGGESPLTMRPCDLPMVTPQQLNDFMAALAEEGIRQKSNSPNARLLTAEEYAAYQSGAANAEASTTGDNDFVDRVMASPATWVGEGNAADVLPLLRRAADPIEEAARIMAAAPSGQRHYVMSGCVHALVMMLFSDTEIEMLKDVYCGVTAGETDDRAADFDRMLDWSRARVGKDGDELLTSINHDEIHRKWLSRRRGAGGVK